MKRILTVALFLTISAIAANAQCDTEALTATYLKFRDAPKATPEQQRAASDTAKEYLSKFADCPGEAETKITAYIKKWQTDYEAKLIDSACTSAVESTPAKALEACKPLLAKDPESLRTYLLLSFAGLKTASDQKLKEQTVKITRKTLELINAGKSVKQWIVADSKEETVATLEFYSAYLTADATPADTAAAMVKLARSTTSYQKDPRTYLYLGIALDKGVDKQLAEYKATCTGKEPSTECSAAYDRIESSIDRVIDAYARVVALTNIQPADAGVGTMAKKALTTRYKQRHEDSEAGLDKYVADVLAKPIP